MEPRSIVHVEKFQMVELNHTAETFELRCFDLANNQTFSYSCKPDLVPKTPKGIQTLATLLEAGDYETTIKDSVMSLNCGDDIWTMHLMSSSHTLQSDLVRYCQKLAGQPKPAPPKFQAGFTPKGSTAWATYISKNVSGNYITLEVKFPKPFNELPAVIASLAGDDHHWTTRGGNCPYFVTETGFTIFVYVDNGSVTPELANRHKWHIHWHAAVPS